MFECFFSVSSDVDWTNNGPKMEPDGGSRLWERHAAAAAAGAGANLHHQHSPDWYPALLSGAGGLTVGTAAQIGFTDLTCTSVSCLCAQVKQSKGADEEESDSELQNLREKLEKSEEERKGLGAQLAQANTSITQLQEEGSCLKERLVMVVQIIWNRAMNDKYLTCCGFLFEWPQFGETNEFVLNWQSGQTPKSSHRFKHSPIHIFSCFICSETVARNSEQRKQTWGTGQRTCSTSTSTTSTSSTPTTNPCHQVTQSNFSFPFRLLYRLFPPILKSKTTNFVFLFVVYRSSSGAGGAVSTPLIKIVCFFSSF